MLIHGSIEEWLEGAKNEEVHQSRDEDDYEFMTISPGRAYPTKA